MSFAQRTRRQVTAGLVLALCAVAGANVAIAQQKEGWLERAQPPREPEPESLVKGETERNGLHMLELDLIGPQMLQRWLWSDDGTRLYCASRTGVVRSIAIPELTIVAERNLNGKLSYLGLSASGIVAYQSDDEKIYVLDAETLRIKRERRAPTRQNAASARGSHFVFLQDQNAKEIRSYDTRSGRMTVPVTVEQLTSMARRSRRDHPIPTILAHIQMTADGRYLFSKSRESLDRFRITSGRLKYDTSFPARSHRFHLSADGQYIVFQHQVDHARPPDRLVSPVTSPTKPILKLNFLDPVYLDPVHERMISHDNKGLVVRDLRGRELRSYNSVSPVHVALHPDGVHALVHESHRVRWVTLPAPKFAALAEPVAIERPAVTAERLADGVRVQEIDGPARFKAARFSEEGESLLVLDEEGLLRRIDMNRTVETHRLQLPAGPQALRQTVVGVVVLTGQSLHIIQPDNLQVERALPVGTAKDFRCPAESHVGYLLRDRNIFSVDLKTGEVRDKPTLVVNRKKPRDRGWSSSWLPYFDPSGREAYFSRQGWTGVIKTSPARWDITEQALGSTALGPLGSEYLAIRRNPPPPNNVQGGLTIYARNNLANPIVYLPGAAFPVAANPKASCIVAARGPGRHLQEFSTDGDLVRELSPGLLQAYDLAWHPDGQRLLVISPERVAVLHWFSAPAATPEPEVVAEDLYQQVPQPDQATQLRLRSGSLIPRGLWSADGEFLYLVEHDGLVRQIEVATMTLRRRIALGHPCSSAALSAEHLVLVSPSTQELVLLDRKTLTVQRRINVARPVTVTAAGNLAAVVSSRRDRHGTIELFDLETGSRIDQVDRMVYPKRMGVRRLRPGSIGSIAFMEPTMTPDGKELYTLTDQALLRWKVDRQLTPVEQSQVFHAQPGATVDTCSDQVVVWLAGRPSGFTLPNDGRETRPAQATALYALGDLTLPLSVPPRRVALSHDGKLEAYVEEGQVVVKDRNTGQRRTYAASAEDNCRLEFSPDGRGLLLFTPGRPSWLTVKPE